MSYSQDRHLFHVLTTSGLCFLCMADEAFGRRVPFAFLEEVKSRFMAAYGGASATALAYAYNTEFSRVLHQQMEYFSSSNSGGDPLSQAKTDLADVRALAVQNIDAVLDRGEKIELLVDKTEVLAGDAFRFKKQASRVKHAQWVKNMKLTVVAVCVGVRPSSLCSWRALSRARVLTPSPIHPTGAHPVFPGRHGLRLLPPLLQVPNGQRTGHQRAVRPPGAAPEQQAHTMGRVRPGGGTNDVTGASCGVACHAGCVSNVRLKEAITPLGLLMAGLPVYSWTWNGAAKALALNWQPTSGVMAQEAMYPEVVSTDAHGYYRVDYSALRRLDAEAAL